MGQFGTRFRLKFPQCLITKGAFCSLMNGKSTLALVGVVFAAAMVIGMATTSAFSTPLVIASSTTVDNQFGMLGHITLTHTDGDGNLKSYIQTDNVIVNVGENCVAEMLFDIATSGTDPCDGASTPVYTSGNGIWMYNKQEIEGQRFVAAIFSPREAFLQNSLRSSQK